MHGCEGEVVQHNALNPEDYVNGWAINSMIRQTGLPSIVPIEKEQSRIYRMWQSKKSETESNEVRTIGKQMDIFDDWELDG